MSMYKIEFMKCIPQKIKAAKEGAREEIHILYLAQCKKITDLLTTLRMQVGFVTGGKTSCICVALFMYRGRLHTVCLTGLF